jgi:hypothetical protein
VEKPTTNSRNVARKGRIMFEVKNYGTQIKIADNEFSVNVGDINFIEKVMEIQNNGINELESLKLIDEEQDVQKKIQIVKEKLIMLSGWINALLCDSKAVDKILGEKKYSIQNVADLFAYVLDEVSKLQTAKLEEKSKEYSPVK